MREASTTSTSVLVIGPDPNLIGGMAQIVAAHLSLSDPAVHVSFLPLPHSTGENGAVRFWRHLRHTFQFVRLIQRENVRIVHLHTCSRLTFWRTIINLFVARGCGCKTILHVHGGEFEGFYQSSNWMARGLIRHGFQLADAVIALSCGWRKTLLRIEPKARVFIIENAVEVPAVLPRSTSTCCRFLFLAKLDKTKGILDALEACRILAMNGVDFHLTLAGPTGTAGDATSINRWIAQCNLQKFVQCVGTKTGIEREQLFADSDVLLFPSWYEGMPLTILEAMVRGVAVIATNVGAISETITDGITGLLIPPQNPARIADAIRSLIEQPEVRQKLANAGKQLAVHRFSTSRFARQLTELYEELAGRYVAEPTDAVDSSSTSGELAVLM